MAAPVNTDGEPTPKSLAREALKRLLRNRLAMVSFGFVVLLTIVGFMSPS